MTVILVHVKRRKKLKAVRGRYLPFIVKHAFFPLRTTGLLVSCSGLWGGCVQTFVKQANFLAHHLGGMTLYQARFHVFLVLFHFVEFKWHGTPCMCLGRETNMFKNSFQFTTHGINSHTGTQIRFLKPLWLAVACKCSSNLNDGH